MALQSKFPSDVFISYQRVANLSRDRWVDTFHQELTLQLQQLIKGEPAIWRDTEALYGGDPWKRLTAAKIDEAAIFLAIVSGSYFQSEECRYEFDRFLGKMKNSESGASRKIFSVLKQPPDESSDIPGEWSTFQQWHFYERIANSDKFKEIGPAGDPEYQWIFWERLSQLAQDLKIAISKLRLQSASQRRAQGQVFLAHAGPELRAQRDRLRADLQLRGYEVVPEVDYIWNTDGHSALITNHLESSLLAIHLVPRVASSEPATATRVRAQLQLAQSTMKTQGKPPPMVWLVPGQLHPSMSDLVNHVQVDVADLGVPIWEGGLDEFKNQVYVKLPRQAVATDVSALPAGGSVSTGGAKTILDVALLAESDEQLALMALKDRLTDEFACEPQVVKLNQGVPANELRMATILSRSDSVIVFWGRQDEDWLQELLRLPALAAFGAGRRLAVYLAKPDSDEKSSFRSARARVLRPEGEAGDVVAHGTLASFLRPPGGTASEAP